MREGRQPWAAVFLRISGFSLPRHRRSDVVEIGRGDPQASRSLHPPGSPASPECWQTHHARTIEAPAAPDTNRRRGQAKDADHWPRSRPGCGRTAPASPAKALEAPARTASRRWGCSGLAQRAVGRARRARARRTDPVIGQWPQGSATPLPGASGSRSATVRMLERRGSAARATPLLVVAASCAPSNGSLTPTVAGRQGAISGVKQEQLRGARPTIAPRNLTSPIQRYRPRHRPRSVACVSGDKCTERLRGQRIDVEPAQQGSVGSPASAYRTVPTGEPARAAQASASAQAILRMGEAEAVISHPRRSRRSTCGTARCRRTISTGAVQAGHRPVGACNRGSKSDPIHHGRYDHGHRQGDGERWTIGTSQRNTRAMMPQTAKRCAS